jgi:SulP family sulfate permease
MKRPNEPKKPLRVASALRAALAEGYGGQQLASDLGAGLVVGVVALPLSMALAIAVDMPPQFGLATAIVGGAVIAVLGGSRVQVSGPTAAFVVILAPIVARFGPAGLLLAGAMAGVILIALGLARMGQLIEFVPYPVTTGFTAGIGVVIATLQMKDFFGLTAPVAAESFPERAVALVRALPTWRPGDAAIGVLTLAILLLWPRFVRRVPAPLAALVLAAVAGWALSRFAPQFEPATIASRFVTDTPGGPVAGIPRTPPLPIAPWSLAGPDGLPLDLTFGLVRELLPVALAIALLGAIESLLSAVVADGMTGYRHDPDAELVAQGIGNLVVPFFGGIAATGAIARTATNVRSGARSPVAAFVHAAVVLAAVVAAAPLLGHLPMAGLAALLLVVAWNMSEVRHVVHTVRTAPRSDVLVLVACLGLTVAFDMVVAVLTGIILAALLFMRRMAEVTGAELVSAEPSSPHGGDLPGVVEYRVAGPLFFGAAAKAMGALQNVDPGARAVLIDLRGVPAMDATGVVNLSSAVARMRRAGVLVVLGGIQDQPMRALLRAGWRNRPGETVLRRDYEQARLGLADPTGKGAASPT